MSGIVQMLFGGGGAPAAPAINFPTIPAPAPVPAPPDRSDAQVQNDAMRQRLAFSTDGGRTVNNLTGGLGVPQSSTYSAVTSILGGVGR